MLLKCTKNLVIGSQMIIMKHDVIDVTGSDLFESKNSDPVVWYDCTVKISGWFPDMEISLTIHQIAEHFEYLETVTKYSTVTHI